MVATRLSTVGITTVNPGKKLQDSLLALFLHIAIAT